MKFSFQVIITGLMFEREEVNCLPGHVSHEPGHFVWIYEEQQSDPLSISEHHDSRSSHFFSGSKLINKLHIKELN